MVKTLGLVALYPKVVVDLQTCARNRTPGQSPDTPLEFVSGVKFVSLRDGLSINNSLSAATRTYLAHTRGHCCPADLKLLAMEERGK